VRRLKKRIFRKTAFAARGIGDDPSRHKVVIVFSFERYPKTASALRRCLTQLTPDWSRASHVDKGIKFTRQVWRLDRPVDGLESSQSLIRPGTEDVKAWIDPEGYRRFVAEKKRAFEVQKDAEMGVVNNGIK
jgi:hypothetical protein